MSDVVMRAEDVGKKYRIRHENRERYTALRDVLARAATTPLRWLNGNSEPQSTTEDFWALQDVSFEIHRGEVVGVIGRNGAGKSTLLKILSRITEPTTGRIRIRGLVSSLLEVGTGFHPELTGRENIFLNGAILGMSRQVIRRQFDEIVAFAEIEKFLDTPVKRYSSGMYVRLAFSVAAHLEPEILIVDEVLAVGDAAFQKRCLGKMSDVAQAGRTILFVTHNMGVVSTLTQRCIYLENGRIAASGNSRDIVELYLTKSIEQRTADATGLDFYRRDPRPDSPVKITAIRTNISDEPDTLPAVATGSPVVLSIDLDVSRALHGAFLTIALKTSHGERVAVLFSGDQDYSLFLEPGRHRVQAGIVNLPLAPGNYFADIGINQTIESVAYEVILDFPILRVVTNGQVIHWLDRAWGVLHLQGIEWKTADVR
jgi:lipopolysaccharide transport system ATP-binding protein